MYDQLTINHILTHRPDIVDTILLAETVGSPTPKGQTSVSDLANYRRRIESGEEALTIRRLTNLTKKLVKACIMNSIIPIDESDLTITVENSTTVITWHKQPPKAYHGSVVQKIMEHPNG